MTVTPCAISTNVNKKVLIPGQEKADDQKTKTMKKIQVYKSSTYWMKAHYRKTK